MSKQVKTYRLHDKSSNGSAKKWQGRMVEDGDNLVPRDPSFLIEWNLEGKQYKKSNATEIKP